MARKERAEREREREKEAIIQRVRASILAPIPTPVPEEIRRPSAEDIHRATSTGELSAQQFGPKQCLLLDGRIQEACGGGFLLLAGRPLSPDECYSLISFLQMQLLPELYDPEFVIEKAPPLVSRRNLEKGIPSKGKS